MKDREVWHAAVHGIPKSRTQLRDLTTTNFLKGIKQLGILVFRGDWSTYKHADNFNPESDPRLAKNFLLIINFNNKN